MKKRSTFIGAKFRSIFLAATFNMFMEYLLVLSDKIIVGQFLSGAALPALTLIEPMNLLVSFAACMLCAGTGMQVSAALGKGDRESAEKKFSQSLILALGIGAVITAFYCGFSRQIVTGLAGDRPETGYMEAYFRYSRFLPVPMLINSVVYPVVLYRGGEKYCNISALITVTSNIGLSILLISVMGMKGIALATVIGYIAGFLPLLIFLRTEKGYMKFRPFFSFSDIRSMAVYSMADAMIYFYLAIFQICMNFYLLSRFGSTAIVVFTGVVNIAGMFASLSDGICEFLLSMVNMYRGEKNVIGEKNAMGITLKVGLLEALAVMILLLVFAGVIPSLMGVTQSAVRSDFIQAVRIYALCTPFFYVLSIYAQYYLYCGKIGLSLALSLFMNLIFPLVFSMLGGLILGMTGVWIAMAAAYPLLMLFAWLLIRSRKGADNRCMFLDREKMSRQHCWDVEMTETGIGCLMDRVEKVMQEQGISRSRINKVLLAIEETQMDDLLYNKNSKDVRIECTVYLEEKITLVLHNTGVSHNATQSTNRSEGKLQTRYRILAGMQNKSYILVNGANRLIFEF